MERLVVDDPRPDANQLLPVAAAGWRRPSWAGRLIRLECPSLHQLVGQHFVDAVQNKDLMLIMGVVLLYATLLIVFNLLVDIAYQFVDPRIQLDA